jgi:hypothetical protein
MRHYLEVLVPFAFLIGIGTASIIRFAQRRISVNPKVVALAIIALVFVPTAVVDFQMHPYQVAFFNKMLGGPAGVEQSGWTRLVYWGEPIKEAFVWLNANAPKDSIIRVDAVQIAKYYARKDMTIVPLENETGNYAIVYRNMGGTPPYERKVKDATVLAVYRTS